MTSPWSFSYPDFSYTNGRETELPATPSVSDLLGRVLAAVKQDGWRFDGWGLCPPHSVLFLLWKISGDAYLYFGQRNKAGQSMRDRLDRVCGQSFMMWECADNRTQDDVERILTQAIEYREEAA